MTYSPQFKDTWFPRNNRSYLREALEEIMKKGDRTGSFDADYVGETLIKLIGKLNDKGILSDSEVEDFVLPRFELEKGR
jgi:hypothetical protein